VNIAEHFLLRFIRKLPMQIKHFLKAFALIGNILWRMADSRARMPIASRMRSISSSGLSVRVPFR
jgi:hypothetical protein